METRGFWDGIAQWFGYDYWAWGSAADWVAGIGTTLAFVGGVFVWWLQLKRSRRAFADKLVAIAHYSPGPDNKPQAFVEYWNTGVAPIYRVTVNMLNSKGTPLAASETEPEGDYLGVMLKEEERGQTKFNNIPPLGSSRLIISFMDANGNSWSRETASYEPTNFRYISEARAAWAWQAHKNRNDSNRRWTFPKRWLRMERHALRDLIFK